VKAAPAAAVGAFAVVAGLLAARAMLQWEPGSWINADFRHAVYYPARAFLHGNNPYDAAAHLATYPIEQRFPLYSPSTLLIHAPWALLPLALATPAHWALTLVLTVVLAALVLRDTGGGDAARTFGLAALILASRPGQQNILNGQPTLELVLAVALVLRYARTRPWIAACGLALAMFKGTWGLPLLVLMLAAGWWRAAALGTVVGVGLNVVATGILAYNAGGLAALVGPLQVAAATTHAIPEGHPALSYTRIDAVAAVGRLIGRSPGTIGSLALTVGLLGVGALAVRRLVAGDPRGGDERVRSHLMVGVVTLTILTCVYQQPYSMLLVFLPLVGLVRGVPVGNGRGVRTVLVGLLTLPLVNFAATGSGLRVLGITDGSSWVLLTSVNGVALLGALAGYLWLALRVPRAPSGSITWREHWDAHPPPAASFAREAAVYVRRLRADFPLSPTLDVIDFGCGFGFVAEAVAPAVRTVAVWDRGAAMRQHARAILAPHANVRWLDLDALDERGDAPAADLILMNSVAQYMTHAELAGRLRALGGMLCPTGRLVVSDIIPPGRSLSWEGLVLALRHPGLVLDRWRVWGPDYLRKLQRLPLLRLSPEDLERLAAEAGLAVAVHRRNLSHFRGRLTAVFTRMES
jgi:SAM-dependent methyltransferase